MVFFYRGSLNFQRNFTFQEKRVSWHLDFQNDKHKIDVSTQHEDEFQIYCCHCDSQLYTFGMTKNTYIYIILYVSKTAVIRGIKNPCKNEIIMLAHWYTSRVKNITSYQQLTHQYMYIYRYKLGWCRTAPQAIETRIKPRIINKPLRI